MPRVLVVTYPWLPLSGPDVRRVARLCRYLPSAGWEPHILTREWSDASAEDDARIRASASDVDESSAVRHAAQLPVSRSGFGTPEGRALRWHRTLHERAGNGSGARALAETAARVALDATYPVFGVYPDAQRAWTGPAVEAGVAAVRQYGISAVVSAGPPTSAHIAAGEIARRAGTPWVALVSELAELYVGPGDGRSLIHRWQACALVRGWLKGMSRAAAGSTAIAEYLARVHGIEGDVVVAPFDPDERRLSPRRNPLSPMRVVHVGPIDPKTQRVELLFDAVDLLLAEHPSLAARIEIDLIGSECEDELAALLRGRPASTVCRLLSRLPFAGVVGMQREADLLLMLDHRSDASPPSDPRRVPPDFAELLSARRPVIALVDRPDTAVALTIRDTKAGEIADDASILALSLRRHLATLQTESEIAFPGDEPAISRHGAPEQAKRLGALIDAASAERFGRWQRA